METTKINDVKEKLLERKKEIEKKLKLIEKKEKERRLKPYFKVVEKYIDNISDKDLEIMTNYVLSRFAKK